MNDPYREIEYVVESGDSSDTVGRILKNRLHMSSGEITRCKLFFDGVMEKRSTDPDYHHIRMIDKTEEGAFLRVRIYENTEFAADVVPSDVPIDIIYEDEDLIVLNKPAKMVVHPSFAHYDDSLSNALAGYYKRTGQNHVMRAIGRLDMETSGIVVFAKNRHSAAILSNQRDMMSKRKTYLALAKGLFTEKEGVVDAPIGKLPDEKMVRRIMESGKRAVTHYKVEEQLDGYALIKLSLETGRTHQIRVHMAHIGHPLLGDTVYGDNSMDLLDRAALHAAETILKHPITGEMLHFKAPLPEDMSRLLGKDCHL